MSDFADGYRAGLRKAWASPKRIRGDVWASPADLGAPADASDEWLDGWRAGLRARW